MPTQNKMGDLSVTYISTITARPKAFQALRIIGIDLLPGVRMLDDGRQAVEAILHENQIADVVAAGAIVKLRSIIDPTFPSARIMSSKQAMKSVDELLKYSKKGK